MTRKRLSSIGNTNEIKYNYALADIFRDYGWANVGAEETNVIVDNAGAKPDIWLDARSKSGWGRGATGAIIIETEYFPADRLETDDVKSRIGKEMTFGKITAVIGIVLPKRFKLPGIKTDAKKTILQANDLEYFVKFEDGGRFPNSGRLVGSVEDVITTASFVSTSREYANDWANVMSSHINKMTEMLIISPSSAKREIMQLLRESTSSNARGGGGVAERQ